MYYIMLILVSKRKKESIEVQKVLTEYGCLIKTRLGLHEIEGNFCSENGLIILQLIGNENEHLKLKGDLEKIDGVKVEYIKLK